MLVLNMRLKAKGALISFFVSGALTCGQIRQQTPSSITATGFVGHLSMQEHWSYLQATTDQVERTQMLDTSAVGTLYHPCMYGVYARTCELGA